MSNTKPVGEWQTTPESNYALVKVLARRARHIHGGGRKTGPTWTGKPTRIARDEVRAGRVPFRFQGA